MEFNAKKAKDIVESDEAQEIVVMTRSSVVASEKIEQWKTAQEEDLVVRDTIERVR